MKFINKTCQKCKKIFFCNSDINGTCWCMSVDFTEIDKKFTDCICKECLVIQPKKRFLISSNTK